MIYHDARQRYMNDAAYHALVDCILAAIENLMLTPGETRDAAMLAAVMFEERRLPSRFVQDPPK